MSSSLITLPDEILAQIFCCIDIKWSRASNKYSVRPTRPNICALAQTCRRLSSIASGELYRQIVFDVGNTKDAPSWGEVRGVEIFTRTCRERPAILSLLQQIVIMWYLDDEEDGTLEALLDAIAPSKSLTSLHLDISELDCELGTSPCALRPLLQHDQDFVGLQELRINVAESDDMPAEMLYKLACLPSLKSLAVRCFVYEPEDDTFRTSPQSTELGQSLGLKDGKFDLDSLAALGYVKQELLDIIISRCPKLTKLKFCPPGLTCDVAMYEADYDFGFRRYLSPKRIVQSLLPVSATLQELSLSGHSSYSSGFNDHDELWPCDSSILQLKELKSLRRLEISALLLPLKSPGPFEEDRMQKMFPVSLEELEIHYGSPQGLFYSANIIANLDSSRPSGLTRSELSVLQKSRFQKRFLDEVGSPEHVQTCIRWYLSLLALRRVDPDHLPHLQSMRIVELDEPNLRCDRLEFVREGYHAELFHDLGVEFEMLLRVPDGYIDSCS